MLISKSETEEINRGESSKRRSSLIGSEEFIPNERLRRARTIKGWSQAELAEQVGTSFEMVSRWERGITAPSPRYRMHLSAALGKIAEELGLVRYLIEPFTTP